MLAVAALRRLNGAFPRRFCCTLPVEIGSTLNVDLPGTRMTINVAGGSNLEQMNFKLFRDGGHTVQDASAVLGITCNMDSVCLEPRGEHDCETLDIVMPEKWCNLLLNAGCKGVYIHNMNEANLRIKTSGGSVQLGRVKGNEACVRTEGGSFSAATLSARCDVNTAGGSVMIEKLIGSKVSLNSGGGRVLLGSFYADDINLHSVEGSVEIDYMHASSNASIASGGGNVRIKGLDGKATITSDGGSVDLQLCDAAKEVLVDSGDGDVVLYLSAQLDAKVEHLRDEAKLHFETRRNRFDDDDDDVEALDTRSRRLGIQDVSCQVKFMGSGRVFVKRRSWLESLKSRLAS